MVFLRFQNFPVEQMKHFEAYLNRGGPVIGLRTTTHTFRIPADGAFAKYSWDYKGEGYLSGFGHQVLGQSWVGHYGRNHRQSTRIDVVADKANHPILYGVKDIWVQAGGYVGKPTDGEILTMAQWVAALDQNDPGYEHHALEALWTTWGMNEADESLLRQLLEAKDFRARAAAVRVFRYNTHHLSDHVTLLVEAVSDEHGRARLEAVVAASWLPNIDAGKQIVVVVKNKPIDDWMQAVVKTAADRLAGIAEVDEPEFVAKPAPEPLDARGKRPFLEGQEIYFREGHCATCHQADGKGLDPAFPSIANSPWMSGDPDRLIKLSLYGLIGPLEIHGKQYDGQVPMTPFGGLLNDQEMAALLTLVRNTFDNKADPVRPSDVKAVRDAYPGRLQFMAPRNFSKHTL